MTFLVSLVIANGNNGAKEFSTLVLKQNANEKQMREREREREREGESERNWKDEKVQTWISKWTIILLYRN